MRWLLCLLTGLGLWVLLFWSLDPWVLGTGAFFALIVAALLGDLYPEGLGKVCDPRRWFWLGVYVPYFLWYVIRANLDVALRVLHPDVPIRPGIVKVRTTLTSEMARTFLANSITLTPGTLTMDVDGQEFYVHWINIHTGDAEKRTAEICGRFEGLLRRIFE